MQTLAADRLRLHGLAWLRFGDVDVRCTVVGVKRWTNDAVEVEVEVEVDGETLSGWRWQGAVDRLAAREDACSIDWMRREEPM